MSSPDFPVAIHVQVDEPYLDDVDQSFVRSVVGAVLAQEGPFDAVDVTIRITDDETIQQLNRTYRDIDQPTDVLSFAGPIQNEGEDDRFALPDDISDQLGDVVISYPTAARQAKEYGHENERELGWLLVHGVLQLIGYDHETESTARVMRQQEEQALATLGLTVQR